MREGVRSIVGRAVLPWAFAFALGNEVGEAERGRGERTWAGLGSVPESAPGMEGAATPREGGGMRVIPPWEVPGLGMSPLESWAAAAVCSESRAWRMVRRVWMRAVKR